MAIGDKSFFTDGERVFASCTSGNVYARTLTVEGKRILCSLPTSLDYVDRAFQLQDLFCNYCI